MRTPIHKIADLEKALGKSLARNLLAAARRGTMQSRPKSVTFTNSKPQITPLDDYGTTHIYGANLKTGEITGSHFAGSYDSILNHANVVMSEGDHAPADHAMLIVQTYWNGRNHSWEVTVVSDNITNQIGAA